MAASLVIFAVLSRLKECLAEGVAIPLAYQGRLAARVKDLQQKLEDILSYMEDADRRRPDEDGEISRLMAEIRDVCYEVEDVLDDLAVKVAPSDSRRSRSRSSFKGVAEGRTGMQRINSIIIRGTTTDRDEVADVAQMVEARIDTLIERVGSLTESLRSLGLGSETTRARKDTYVTNEIFLEMIREDDLFPQFHESIAIGIEDDVRDITDLLVHGKRESQRVIFLVGPGGSGKTMLANLVLESHRGSFEGSAWVTVSEMNGTISVFKSILQQLGKGIDNPQLEDDTKIVDKLFQVLQSKKCLIVLDDLVSFQVWETLGFAFAYQQTNSKVLVTTRSIPSDLRPPVQESGGLIHKMRPLSEEDSWELFRRTALAHWREILAEDDYKKMEDIGKKITRLYRGQPLVVKMLANSLQWKSLRDWERVYENIDSYQEFGKSSSAMGVLNATYSESPYHVKACFSYLGTFPENSEIEVEKLFQLWMAEGILPSSGEGEEGLIGMGHRCLHDLYCGGLVDIQVEDVPTIRGHKSCSLRNVTHQFCSSKLKESRFLEVMDLRHFSYNIPAPSRQASPPRRLAVYLDLRYEDGYPNYHQKKMMLRALGTADYVRSLLFVNVNRQQQCISWPQDVLDLDNFRFLKVLGFDGCSFQTGPLPRGIGKLLLLKYFSLKGCYLEELPSCIGNLSYLQTLDLQVTTLCKITIPDILWKLERLMHLYLPVAFQAKGGGKLHFAGLRKLQILKNFDTRVCHAQHLLGLSNIRFLGATTSGSDEDLKVMIQLIKKTTSSKRELTLDVRNFDCYSSKRREVITELFRCRGLHTLHIEGHIGQLPLMNFIGLIKLYFRGSELVVDPMPRLGRLRHLWVLVLSDAAFVGKDMFCPGKSFPELRRLRLSGLRNLETLTIEDGAMAKLTTLTIERCKRLKVSKSLRDFHKRHIKLHIAEMPKEFENGLRQVEQNSKTSESSAVTTTRDELLFPEAYHQYSTA